MRVYFGSLIRPTEQGDQAAVITEVDGERKFYREEPGSDDFIRLTEIYDDKEPVIRVYTGVRRGMLEHIGQKRSTWQPDQAPTMKAIDALVSASTPPPTFVGGHIKDEYRGDHTLLVFEAGTQYAIIHGPQGGGLVRGASFARSDMVRAYLGVDASKVEGFSGVFPVARMSLTALDGSM